MLRVIVNGEMIPFESTKMHISYDEIEELSKEPEPTVILRYKDGTYKTLLKNQVAKIESGMTIDAINTGRA